MSEMNAEEAMEQQVFFDISLEKFRVACQKYGDYSSRMRKLRAKFILLNTVPHGSDANTGDDGDDFQIEEQVVSKEL
ncbi:unnamed protein product [Sphagnum balticum]